MSEELKPCPFCGGTDIRRSGDNGYGAFWVICEDCGVSTGETDIRSQDEADARWNRRALTSSDEARQAQGEATELHRWMEALMRRAESFKEPCGMDPESPAAIRNGRFADIAGMAAQALGLMQGPPVGAYAPQHPLDSGESKTADEVKHLADEYAKASVVEHDAMSEYGISQTERATACRAEAIAKTALHDAINRLASQPTASPLPAPEKREVLSPAVQAWVEKP